MDTRSQLEASLKRLNDSSEVLLLQEDLKKLKAEHEAAADLDAKTAVQEKMQQLTDKVYSLTTLMQNTVTNLKTNQGQLKTKLKSIQDNENNAEAYDLITKQLMADFAQQYRLVFVQGWAKLIVGFLLAYMMFTPLNATIVVGAFIAMVVIWFLVAFIQDLISSSEGGEKMVGAPYLGESCPSPAPTPTPETGFCPDGVTKMQGDDQSGCPVCQTNPSLYWTDASGNNCPLDENALCPDGSTRADPGRTNCKKCATDPSIFWTDATGTNCPSDLPEYCPDGLTVANADKSNCTLDAAAKAAKDKLDLESLNLKWWHWLVIVLIALVLPHLLFQLIVHLMMAFGTPERKESAVEALKTYNALIALLMLRKTS